MKTVLYAAACAAVLFSGAAEAATIYNEAVDGDAFGSVLPGTDLGTLASDATSTILGSFDAGGAGFPNGPDEQDSYTFTVLDAFTVDATTLGGDDAKYSLWQLPALSKQADGSPGTNIFGSFGAGTYSVTLIGFPNNAGAGDYRIDINVGRVVAPVPLPASVPLLLAGLGALCLVARRRRSA